MRKIPAPSFARSPKAQRSRNRLLALEPRYLFDGIAIVDALLDPWHTEAPTVLPDTAPRTEAAVANADLVGPLAGLSHSRATGTAALFALDTAILPSQDAAALAAQAIRDFLITPGGEAALSSLFPGQQGASTEQQQNAAEALRQDILAGRYSVQVQAIGNAEIGGVFGAFAADGPAGRPTVFVNRDWIAATPGREAVSRVLIEEFGHSLDHALNGNNDTSGDEGEAFAAAVLNFNPSAADRARIAAEDDHSTITVDGQTYQVEDASITFTRVYQGTPRSWSEEAQSITTYASPVAGTNFRFVSSNPSDLYYSGNNVTGYLQYTDNGGNAQSVYGVISRLFKTPGNNVVGLYFYAPGADGLINGVGDSSYLICLDSTQFTGNTEYGTSSDPVDTALNRLIVPNSAPVAANDTATVLEDGSVSGNVLTNDSDANNDTLTVTAFSVAGSAGTVGAAKSISGVGSITVSSNGSYTFTPLANYAGPVPAIRYTVSDGSATMTGNLSIGITPVNDAPAGADKTITTREDTGYTFNAADFGFSDPTDSPANALSTVRITTLPAAGTLTLNSAAVTQGQEIAASAISALVYTPAANASGTGYASFTFQVRDNGGTANGGIDLDPSPNTISVNVTAGNDAPTAGADVATAVEAGGTNNGTAGTTPTGNLLTNDSDPDSGDSKSVASASSAATATTAVGTNSAIAGVYGTLTVSSDGSYSYAVNNSNAAVQALRQNSNTLTDTFSYTMQDGGALASSSTLTVTIQGANDTPVAADDYNTAKESIAGSNNYSGSDTTGHTATGNVLTNDTDVDRNGETRTVVGINSSASGSTTSSSTVLSFTTLPNNVSVGYYVFLDGDVIDNNSNPGTLLRDAGNIAITITSIDSVNKTFTLSATVANATLSTNQLLGFANSTGGAAYKDEYISSSTVSAGTQITLTSVQGTIAQGMAVAGSGIAANTTVSAVTYDGSGAVTSVTISQAAALSSTPLTFSAAAGTTVTGRYGALALAADGSYTYTPTANNAALSEGQSGVDSFGYGMQDVAGTTSSATLRITVLGSGTNDPRAVADTATAVEAGGTSNGTAGTNPTGSVIGNDTATVGTISVVAGRTSSASSETAISSGSYIDFAGLYGTLRLNSDGTYTYTVANSNAEVQELRTSGNTLTDTFAYRIRNTAGTPREDSNTLTVTIQGANDAPVATADTAGAREAGGTGNANAGYNPSGNVLANDTDVDSADTATVSAITGGTVGQAKSGTYGSVTLNADGSYTYTVDNGNAAVQALAAGAALTDTFTYTVRDTAGLTSSNTLTVTINGANDAPVNTLPGTQSLREYQSLAITTLSVDDADGNLQTVQLTVASGTLAIGNLNGASVSAGANSTATLTLSGTQTQINAALATLTYQGNAYFSGTDTLTVVSTDGGGLQDTDTLVITVNPDDRVLSVNSITVNEGSPYAVFTVTGVAGQKVSLALGSTSTTSDVDASSGADFSPNLEYYDGSQWQAYSGAPVAIPAGGTTLLVRTAINNDSAYEGAETFTLVASNTAGAAVTGTATIKDDGTGVKYPGTLTGGTPDTSSSDLDDDRNLTVNNIQVNEGSPYAVFTVDGVVGQSVSLALRSATATVGTDTGSGLQYYDGSAWQTYSAAVAVPDGGKLFVRTTIANDGVYEGPESFGLAATNTGGATAMGTALVLDDGTGTKYPGGLSGGNPVTETTSLDDDRTLTVSSPTVNEASPHTVFTVNGNAGQQVTLTLGNDSDGATANATLGTDTAATATLEVWDAGTSAWVAYDAANKPVVPGSSGTGNLLVRIGIVNDTPYEGAETLTLTAAYVAGGTKEATGVATIVDDGTGVKYPGTVTGGNPDTSTSGLDDDRALTVNNVTVSEASPYAVFNVGGAVGQSVTLALQGGTATLGTDTGTTLQYFDGSNWQTYSGAVAIPAGGNLLVRVAITNDSPYEGAETFTLRATNTGGSTFSGTGTIVDDGSSTNVFNANTNSATPAAGTADDDRSAVTIDSPTVAEGGYAVFTVSLDHASTGAISFTPVLSSGTATVGTDTAASGTLEVSTDGGGNWSTVSGAVTIPALSSSIQLRIATTDDALAESSENFTLSTGTITGTVTSTSAVVGTATITDNDSAPTLSVNDVTINEAAGTATFTVTRSGATGGTATVNYATSNGTATAGSDYTTTAGTVSFAAGETSKTFTVAITNDGIYEGGETLNVTLSNAVGATIADGSGVGTIRDDGTGTGGTDNDTPTVSIDSPTVAEGGYAVFTVSLDHASTGAISFTPVLSSGTATVGTDTAASGTLEVSTDGGGNWSTVSGAVTIPALSSSIQLRIATTDDALAESSENFTLSTGTITGTVTSTSAVVGTATITDNDSAPTLSVNDVTINEAAGTATFTVTRSGATGGTATVNYATSNGTATAGSDYTTTAGTVSFAAGETSKTFTVAITNDGIYEGGETLNVTLSNAVGATIADGSGVGTIRDDGTGTGGTDNDTPTIAVNSVTVSEASPYAVFTVTLDHASTGAIGFNPVLSSGTGTAGTDTGAGLEYYNGTNWVSAADGVTLAGGTTEVLLRTTIANDGVFEGSENLTLSTGAVTGTVANSGGVSGTVTIRDDGGSGNIFDGSPNGTPVAGDANDDTPTIAVNSVTVSEASPYAVFTVTLDHASTAATRFNPVLISGTGTVGTDTGTGLEYYNGTAWVSAAEGVTMTGGTTQVLLRTTITSDGIFEGSESLTLSTGAVTGALTNGSGAIGTVTIRDDGGSTNVFDGGPSGTPSAGSANNDAPPPTISSVTTDTGTSPTDFITGDNTIALSGTWTAGAGVLTVTFGNTTYTLGTDAALTSPAPGLWVLDLTDRITADGTYTAVVEVTDPAGHVGRAAQDVVIDTSRPATPTVVPMTTYDDTPTLTGQAVVAAGETLTVSVDGNVYTLGDGHLTLDAATSMWVLTIPDGRPLSVGRSYDVAATISDAAGNTATDTTSSEVAVLAPPSVAPPAPVVDRPVIVPVETAVPQTPASVPARSGGADSVALTGADSAAGNTGARMVIQVVTPVGSQLSRGDQGNATAAPTLESTDRGFPVERLQSDAVRTATVQDQQKGGDRLFVYNGIKSTTIQISQALDYRVPKDAFGHTNTAAVVQLEASMSDGAPLPEWMDFDPTSGTFSGRPPTNAVGAIDVKVTARDDQGREVTSNFKMQIEGGQSHVQPEKPVANDEARAKPGPGADAGDQDAPLQPMRLGSDKPAPAKRGTVPFSDQLKLSKRDAVLEKVLARQHAGPIAAARNRMIG